ncbi:hypothetical protein [Streptomyces hirsutus]|uniref:hypothetical protein n=1 Tax=Streptomyces hirsutus TaxID=35620 RepID=UPI00368580D0
MACQGVPGPCQVSVGRPVLPVIWFQVSKRRRTSAQYRGAVRRWRRGLKCGEIAVDGDAFAIDPGDLWFKGCNTGAANLICEMKKP